MEPTWRKNLRLMMKERGVSAKELGRRIGRNERLIYDWLSKTDGPRIDTLELASEALGITLTELVSDETATRQTIKISGIVTAGDGWTITDDANLGSIVMEVCGEAVAVEVTGDSMVNYYRHGDILIGVKRYSPNEYIGRDCIIETADGQRLLKYVHPGSMRGRVTLRSYNIAQPDMVNVSITWAAPVQWIKRGRMS